MNKKYQIKRLKQLDKETIKQWKSLWKHADNANIFNSYEWFLTCIKTTESKTYEIIVCYDAEKLVALLPLQAYRQFGIKVLGSISKEHLVDTPFLMETYDEELLRQFFTFVFTHKNIYLQKIDGKAVQIMHTVFPTLFFSLMSVNPIISLDSDSMISSSTIKQIKKIMRKNTDQLRFIMFDNNLKKHLQTMFVLEKESSKKLRSMDIFSKRETKKFYQEVIKNCSELVRICFLYFNEVPIAYQYGYWQKESFVCDQIAYRNEYSRLRPGKTLLYFLIEELKKSPLKTIDLGGGISNYKIEFTHEYRLLYNMYYSSNMFIVLWWKIINIVRRAKQIIMPLKNTQDHKFLFKELHN